jgi:hypothetical protein
MEMRLSVNEIRPDGDCGSDYELLTATTRIKLKDTTSEKRLETGHRQYT